MDTMWGVQVPGLGARGKVHPRSAGGLWRRPWEDVQGPIRGFCPVMVCGSLGVGSVETI